MAQTVKNVVDWNGVSDLYLMAPYDYVVCGLSSSITTVIYLPRVWSDIQTENFQIGQKLYIWDAKGVVSDLNPITIFVNDIDTANGYTSWINNETANNNSSNTLSMPYGCFELTYAGNGCWNVQGDIKKSGVSTSTGWFQATLPSDIGVDALIPLNLPLAPFLQDPNTYVPGSTLIQLPPAEQWELECNISLISEKDGFLKISLCANDTGSELFSTQDSYYGGNKSQFITCKCTINSGQSTDNSFYWRFYSESGCTLLRLDLLGGSSFCTNFYGHKIADFYHEF